MIKRRDKINGFFAFLLFFLNKYLTKYIDKSGLFSQWFMNVVVGKGATSFEGQGIENEMGTVKRNGLI